MANRVAVTILSEGYRNVNVFISGVLDTSNLSAQTVLTLANCTNNDPAAGTLTAFAVEEIEYAVSSPLICVFDWHATSNQLLATVCDSNELCFHEAAPLRPANILAAGFNGTVELATFGWAGTVGFSVLLQFLKIYR